MNTLEHVENAKGKKVLLMSSGMDSYIINNLEKPDVQLFIDNNSEYSKIELEYIEKMNLSNLIVVRDFIDTSTIEREDAIIPLRNLFFTSIASLYGDEIILGATIGDRSSDKDLTFASLTTDVLKHIWTKSHWNKEDRDININLKYKNYTKEDLIRAFVELRDSEGVSKEMSIRELSQESFSCYHPKDGEQCNSCKPDVRKYLAILGATGIDIGKYYKYKPIDFFTPKVIDEWLEKESSGSRGRESIEIINTLNTLKK